MNHHTDLTGQVAERGGIQFHLIPALCQHNFFQAPTFVTAVNCQSYFIRTRIIYIEVYSFIARRINGLVLDGLFSRFSNCDFPNGAVLFILTLCYRDFLTIIPLRQRLQFCIRQYVFSRLFNLFPHRNKRRILRDSGTQIPSFSIYRPALENIQPFVSGLRGNNIRGKRFTRRNRKGFDCVTTIRIKAYNTVIMIRNGNAFRQSKASILIHQEGYLFNRAKDGYVVKCTRIHRVCNRINSRHLVKANAYVAKLRVSCTVCKRIKVFRYLHVGERYVLNLCIFADGTK